MKVLLCTEEIAGSVGCDGGKILSPYLKLFEQLSQKWQAPAYKWCSLPYEIKLGLCWK